MGGLFKNKVSSKSGKYASELDFRWILGVILEPRGAHELKKICLFDVGFLELQRITWDAPAALLENLANHEAVHAIRSWQDIKHRLAVGCVPASRMLHPI